MLNLYGDVKSQPARAVWIFVLENEKLIGPYKICEVRISKNEHKTPEFLSINPIGKVPAIKDESANDLKMFESHAIMKYICQSRKLADHWYPTSSNKDI